MTASLLILYPHPANPAQFDKAYREEHLPLASTELTGVVGVTTHPVLGTPGGKAPYHLVTEVKFSSLDALQTCAASAGGQKTIAHAQKLSTGGPALFLITNGS